MRVWERNPFDTKCGKCSRRMAVGEPRQVITPDGSRAMTRKFYRCRTCSEGEPPTDLPPLPTHPGIEPQLMVRAGKVKLPFDYKLAAVGREPGEDG